jgi:hypothetical protein
MKQSFIATREEGGQKRPEASGTNTDPPAREEGGQKRPEASGTNTVFK